MIFPTDTNTYNVSSFYGFREIDSISSFHSGVDFPVPCGTNVYATLSGTVTFSGFMNGYGNCIVILHDSGLKSLYGHLSEGYMASLGQDVRAGELIALVGPKYLSDGRLNRIYNRPPSSFFYF